MKVIAMNVMTKMMSSIAVQVQASSRVPSLGAPLVSCSPFRQAALKAVLHLLTEKLAKGHYTSFPYQTTQGQNIPSKRTKIEIWANNPPPKKLAQSSPLPTKLSHLCLSAVFV